MKHIRQEHERDEDGFITQKRYDTDVYNGEGDIVRTYYTPDRNRNIVNTFYWYYDLQGRLKQELTRPVKYHGQERMYVKEDIESLPDNSYVSHLTVMYGPTVLARTNKTFYVNITDRYGIMDVNYRNPIKVTVNYLLEGGWKLYKIGENATEFRKKKVVKKSITRKPCKCKPIRKSIKKKVKK